MKIRPAALVFQVRVHSGERAFHEPDLGRGKSAIFHSLVVEEQIPRDEVR